jgi:Tfp pilus assembly protein PilV
MIAALIFVISMVALIQFGVYSWRAAFLSVAATPVSEEIRAALGACAQANATADYETATEWLKLSPNLSGHDRQTWQVRAYFAAVHAIGSLMNSTWAQREMEACGRFVAVVADERLQRNRLCIAEMNSF